MLFPPAERHNLVGLTRLHYCLVAGIHIRNRQSALAESLLRLKSACLKATRDADQNYLSAKYLLIPMSSLSHLSHLRKLTTSLTGPFCGQDQT